jgi:OmpA-OmpF porin, OOP family
MKLRLALAVVVTCLSFVTGAWAQNASDGEFTVQRFQPAPGPRNLVTVEGARTDGKMAFSVATFANYASDPFVVRSCISQTDCANPNATQPRDIHVIRDLVTLDLLASLTVIPRLQLGLRVPYTFVSGDGIQTDLSTNTAGQELLGGIKGSGLGDPMLEGKLRAFGSPGDPYVLGVAAFFTGPAGHATAENKYIGDASPTVGLRGIFDGQVGPIGFIGNLAGMYRKTAVLGSTELGSEFRYGVGARYKATPVLQFMAEGFGGTKFSSRAGTNSLEAIIAAEVMPLNSIFSAMIGGGLGVIEGAGVPKYRVFAGLALKNERSDQDGDGVPDTSDQCPTVPEDNDGFQDPDGCPDPDNDADGFPDPQDKCPNEAEVKNGYQDSDGCPDEVADKDQDGIPDTEDKCPDQGGQTVVRRQGEFYGCPDSDRDGVPDKIDKCPNDPEDTDGYQDSDGCPDPDNDGDGIADSDDQCVDVPEVVNGYQDADGCPDTVPDRDKDGIPDNKDKCPDAPENYNGFQDDDGCPDKGPALVEVQDDAIKIKDVINFANDSDKIVGKRSFQVLDAVASVLVHHPEIFKVEVAGHTDDKGDKDHNTDLSKRRAASVMAYLNDHGVETKRMTSAGYGPDQPIADNKTAAGRAKNRRVEFRILQSTKKPGTPSEGGAAPSPPPAGSAAPPSKDTPKKDAPPSKDAPPGASPGF